MCSDLVKIESIAWNQISRSDFQNNGKYKVFEWLYCLAKSTCLCYRWGRFQRSIVELTSLCIKQFVSFFLKLTRVSWGFDFSKYLLKYSNFKLLSSIFLICWSHKASKLFFNLSNNFCVSFSEFSAMDWLCSTFQCDHNH